MAGLGNVMPSLGKIGNGGHWILDLVFRDNALIMSDTQILANAWFDIGIDVSVPLPIIGFSFENPSELNILRYTYTEYPMLNKTAVVNSFVKEMGSIRIRGIRPITRGNSIALNYVANKGLVLLIEKYADLGGRWAVNTMWGTFGNLVLESLDGEVVENAGGGTGFTFTFKRVNFDAFANAKKGVSAVISKFLS